MRSKWLTVALAGLLGLMTVLGPSNQSLTWAGDGESNASEPGNIDGPRGAHELLKQAAAELHANRVDAARRLARQASALNASYSLFDVRPEHILAEIDRRERAGVVGPARAIVSEQRVTQPPKLSPLVSMPAQAHAETADPFEPPKAGNAAASPAPQAQSGVPQQRATAPNASTPADDAIKARAIEILDRGLQALDEKRLDDAEGYAKSALLLHAAWTKFEYRPENLITEIGIARASLRLAAAPSGTAAPTAPSAPPPHATTPVAANAQGANSSRERAERLLREAMVDLREGHDDIARARIEGALGAIHPVAPRPLLWPGGSPPSASLMARQGLPLLPRAGVPSYVIDPAADEHDIALKPLHDPFLGDDPMSTQNCTAGEKSMRETTPRFVSPNPNYTLNRPLPVIGDDAPQTNAASPKSTAATSSSVQTQTGADSIRQAANSSLEAPAQWPESAASAPPTFASAAAQPAGTPAAKAPVDQVTDARVPAPITPPLQPAAKWLSPARAEYIPPATDPWAPAGAEDQHPGYFRRLWHALGGE